MKYENQNILIIFETIETNSLDCWQNDFVRENEKSSPLFHLSLRITFRICDEVHHDDDVNWFH